MKSLIKLGVLGVVVAFTALVAGASLPASATPTSLTVNGLTTTPQTFALGINIPVVATYQDEGANLVLTSSNPAVAYFNAFGAATVTPLDGETVTPAGLSGTITVTDDADALAEAKTLTANLLCVTNGTTNISYTQGSGTSSTIVVNCGTGAGTTTITVSPTSTTVGSSATVTAACTAAGQILTANVGSFVSTNPTNGTFVSTTQVNCVAAGTNMVATYTCTVAAVTTFTFGGIASPNTLNCAGTTTGGLVLSATTGMGGTVSGTCPAVNSLLTQTGSAQFVSATINGLPVTVTAGSVNCTAAGPIVASFTCNYTGTSTTVQFALGSMSATFYCSNTTGYPGGYPYNNYPYTNTNCGTGTYNTGVYPYNQTGIPSYNTGVYPYNQYNTGYNTNCYNQQQYTNVPTSLTVTSASPSVACGSTAAITVRVVGTNGGTVADGTAVSLSSSIGSLSPASATTTAGGVVQATFNAPSNISTTTATLKAIAGAASNTTTVSVTCTQTTAPSAPSTAPVYTSPPPPPSTLPVITPPSTGDAGLLAAIRDEECN